MQQADMEDRWIASDDCASVSTTSIATGGRVGEGLHIPANAPPRIAVLLLSSTVLERQAIERRPDNDRHRLRAIPPATGLDASGSDEVLKTNSDEYLCQVRISNVCARRAQTPKSRLQSAF